MLPPVEVLWNWAHLTISLLTLHLLSLFTASVLILTWVALFYLCCASVDGDSWLILNRQYIEIISMASPGMSGELWQKLQRYAAPFGPNYLCNSFFFLMLSITHQGKIHSYRWPPCGSSNHFNHFPGPWLWESSCLLLVPADCYKNTFISAFPVLKPTFLLCLGIVG